MAMLQKAMAFKTDAFCVNNNQMVVKGDTHDRKQLIDITSDRNTCVMVSTRHLDDFVQGSLIAHDVLMQYSPLCMGRSWFGRLCQLT